MPPKKATLPWLHIEVSRLTRVVGYQHMKLCQTWAWVYRVLPVLDMHDAALAHEMREYIAHDQLESWMSQFMEEPHVEEVAVAA